jgi:hypothetical protein
MKRPRLYICGAYTAPTWPEIRANIKAARIVGGELNLLGYTYSVVPHSMGRGMEGSLTPQEWYDFTLGEMMTCDAVYVMRGFRASTGSQNEILHAARANMPIVYAHEPERLDTFLRELKRLFDFKAGGAI